MVAAAKAGAKAVTLPRLVPVQPPDVLGAHGLAAGDEQGRVDFAVNGCPGRGAMDVFVEPMVPRPHPVTRGATPVALAVADLGRRMEFAVRVGAPPANQSAFAGAGRGARYLAVATRDRDHAALRRLRSRPTMSDS
jgi:xanthine dehydrogenase accessory factor